MPVEFQQMLLLPTVTYGANISGAIKATVKGSDSDDDIVVKCRQEFPYAVRVRNSAGVLVWAFRQDITLNQKGPELWEATAKYNQEEPKDNDRKNANDPNNPLEAGRYQFDINFDIGTATKQLKYGLSHVNTFAVQGETGTAYDGAPLNVRADGEVIGAQIDVPILTFSETHYLENTVITDFYLKLMYKLVGSVNSTTTRGFPAGELLLKRITGSKRNSEQWQLTYSWAYSENFANKTINGATVTKKGWEYMWEEWGKDFDAGTEGLKPKLIAYHVEQVYENKDHNQLEGVSA